jgi:hypothetical protein
LNYYLIFIIFLMVIWQLLLHSKVKNGVELNY